MINKIDETAGVIARLTWLVGEMAIGALCAWVLFAPVAVAAIQVGNELLEVLK